MFCIRNYLKTMAPHPGVNEAGNLAVNLDGCLEDYHEF